jgi:hypothetical protein
MNVRTWVIRWFSPKLIGTVLIPAIALAASDNGTLTVGKGVSSTVQQPSLYICASGYQSPSLGSYSPTGLSGGKTVHALWDFDVGGGNPSCPTPVSSFFSAAGFSSNPGQSWTTSVTCGGVSKTGASATYSYSGGIASWQWSSTFGFNAKPLGSNVSCTIVHN